MAHKIAFQMDPIAAIDIAADTSFALALEAQARGFELYYYEVPQMVMQGHVLHARVSRLEVADVAGAHFALAAPQFMPLREMDVILMRQDPPFDMNYITITHFLESLMRDVLIVNDPVAVRNAPEKLLPLQFPELIPASLMTRDYESIKAFRAEHGDIILKPLYGCGGADIFRLRPEDENFNALLSVFLQRSDEPLIVQEYLPAVRAGDKRVILIDGEAKGALNRVPSEGEARSNLHVGGTPESVSLTPRDEEIVAALTPFLREQNIILAGIDIIGDYLTEINITSPTGMREIKAFGGEDIALAFWDAVAKRL